MSRAGSPAFLLTLCAVLLLPAAARADDYSARLDKPERSALGKLLFFDKRLSRDGTVSCSTCHDPHKGWTDHRPVSVGIGGKKGRRNAQSILNAAMYYAGRGTRPLFWDGRSSSLEEQAINPIVNPDEMGSSTQAVIKTLSSIAGYRPYFESAYGDGAVTVDRIAASFAAFEKTLVSMKSPFDRYQAGDEKAVSPEAVKGFKLVMGKGTCTACHSSVLFSDAQFHNIGVGQDKKPPDLGRFEVTKEDRDRGAYRTPTLRNLRYTGPYMHDGTFKTLADVLDFYDKGGLENPWLDPDVQPLHLTRDEKKQLLAFLDSLNGDPLETDPPKNLPR